MDSATGVNVTWLPTRRELPGHLHRRLQSRRVSARDTAAGQRSQPSPAPCMQRP